MSVPFSMLLALLKGLMSWLVTGLPTEETTTPFFLQSLALFLVRLMVTLLMYLILRELVSSGLVTIAEGAGLIWATRAGLPMSR